jgi:hypothetical protein
MTSEMAMRPAAVTGNGIATLKREIAKPAKGGRRKAVEEVAG